MYKFIFICASIIFICETAEAGNINYGYNNRGDYVPTSVGSDRIGYGYNNRGDYVPTSIGGY